MGFEVIWGVLILFFVILIVFFAPTLLAVALRREGIFSILAVNYLPSLIGWAFLGWVIAMAWAIFGAGAKPRPKAPRAKWDILP